MNTSELKIELFRYIDKLNDHKLVQLYKYFIESKSPEVDDFWDLLSDWEKEDINAGLDDLKNGKKNEFSQVLSKYQE
jgi:hypothetical protein